MEVDMDSTGVGGLENPDIDRVITSYNDTRRHGAKSTNTAEKQVKKPLSDEELFLISLDFSGAENEDGGKSDTTSSADNGSRAFEWDLDDLLADSFADIEEQRQKRDSMVERPDKSSTEIALDVRKGAQETAQILNDGLKYTSITDVVFSPNDIGSNLQKKILESSQPDSDSFHLNFFYLLAKHGNFLLSSASAKQGIEWANSKEWYLCSIKQDGQPWDINNPSQLFKRLTAFIGTEDNSAHQKAVKLQLSGSDKLLQSDWVSYQRNRMLLLQTKGQQFFEHLSTAKDRATRSISLKDKRGCLYSNNSCALDSILFVFPHLYWHLFKKDLFGVTDSGVSYATKAPGAIVVGIIMQDLFSIGEHHYRQRFHHRISNYLRVLIQDLSSFYRKRGNPLPRVWEPFGKNEFVNLNEVMWYILPRLLAANGHTSISSKLDYKRRAISNEVLEKADACSQFTLFLREHVLCKEDRLFEGCLAVQIDGNVTPSNAKMVKKLLSDTSTYSGDGYELKVIGFVGYEGTSERTHFISGVLFRANNGRERVYVYNGMQNGGKPKGVTLHTAFCKKDSLFLTPFLLALVICSKAKIID